MNAVPSPDRSHSVDQGLPPEGPPVSASDLFLGLQFCRANVMSLTRLQLALKSGDRQCALEAMDRLHALDTEMERLAMRLPVPENDAQERMALGKHLADQKLAIAFEKLALVSEISGPDLVSPPTILQPEDVEEDHALPESLTWSAAPAEECETERRGAIPMQTIFGFLMALLTIAALAAAAMFMTTL